MWQLSFPCGKTVPTVVTRGANCGAIQLASLRIDLHRSARKAEPYVSSSRLREEISFCGLDVSLAMCLNKTGSVRPGWDSRSQNTQQM
jgi:hypothetical protein